MLGLGAEEGFELLDDAGIFRVGLFARLQLLALEPDVSSISVYTTSSVETAQYKKLSDAKIKVLQSLPYAELIESLSSHAVCVANNSFGAHIAILLGLQTLGVYSGHETVTEWAPVFGDSRVVYTPVECSPCHIAQRRDCNQDFKCLQGIASSNTK